MKASLAAAGTAAALLLTTGCAQSLTSADASSAESAEATAAAAVQDSVESAVTAAKAYGQDHLGHYLEMEPKDLRASGFTPTPDVDITVYIDHVGVCVNAVSTTLPAGSEWSTATATSQAPDAVAGGACSEADALKQVVVRG